MDIKVDDLNSGEVIQLLKEHLEDMYLTSPSESVHALDINALKAPEITFFSCWKKDQLLGCVAIKELDSKHAELKSMRTSNHCRGTGVGTVLLKHVLYVASNRGYSKISLETGSQEFFKPARNLMKNLVLNTVVPSPIINLTHIANLCYGHWVRHFNKNVLRRFILFIIFSLLYF